MQRFGARARDAALHDAAAASMNREDDIREAENLTDQAHASIASGQFDAALQILSKAEKSALELLGDNHEVLGNLYNILGLVYWSKAENEKSLEFLFKSLKIREQQKKNQPKRIKQQEN